MVLVAIAMLLSNAVSLTPPPAIAASLAAADVDIAFVDMCLETHPALRAEDFAKRNTRYVAERSESEGVWGPLRDLEAEDDTTIAHRICHRNEVRAALHRIDVALDAHAAAFRSATPGIDGGLWIGAIHVCHEDVLDSMISGDPPAFSIQLTQDAAAVLETVISRSINARIAIRLNGAVIARPVPYDPIVLGRIAISGTSRGTLERVLQTLGAPCP
jgi:hypothetical protein